jgi:hypothetical protein
MSQNLHVPIARRAWFAGTMRRRRIVLRCLSSSNTERFKASRVFGPAAAAASPSLLCSSHSLLSGWFLLPPPVDDVAGVIGRFEKWAKNSVSGVG